MKTSKRRETDFMKRSVIKLNQNLKRAKAIEHKNKQRLLAVNPNLMRGAEKVPITYRHFLQISAIQ